MYGLLQDVAVSLRSLRKRPGFAAAAVLIVALGIGVNTAVATVANAALLRPLPYADPDGLIHLWERTERQDFSQREASYPDFADWSQSTDLFSSVAGYTRRGYAVGGDAPEQIAGAEVTAGFFDTLGVRPALGRGFTPEETAAGAGRAVLLTDALWRRRFGADPNVVGRDVTLNLRAYTVVGVLPKGFEFAPANGAELYAPLNLVGENVTNRRRHYLNVIARLAPGVSVEKAQAGMDGVARRIAADYPESHAGVGLRLVPLRDEIVGSVRPVLMALLGAVAVVMLVACANVANLLLARHASRRREFAVRQALGAGRWRLARQLLVESVAISALGGAAGLVLAGWIADVFVAAIPAAQMRDLPFLRDLSLDWRVLAFSLSLSLATGVAFGLGPALGAWRRDLADALAEKAPTGAASPRLRDALVVSEVALSLVLLVSAGLLLRSFVTLLRVDVGFDPQNLSTMYLTLPGASYNDPVRVAAFHRELVSRVSAVPGVRGAAVTSELPLVGGGTMHVMVDGRPTRPGEETETISRDVSVGYFDVMGVPVLSGRTFGETDTADAPPVLVINRTLAERLFPNEEAVGKRVRYPSDPDVALEIVGVVGDEKVGPMDAATPPAIYDPIAQSPSRFVGLVVRTGPGPDAATLAVRDAIRELDPDVSVFSVATMERRMAASPATFLRRYPAMLIGAFAAVALALSVVGIYGVIAYSVAQRTREIGVRMAMGARGRDIFRLVAGRGLLLALAGVAVGIPVALVATRFLSSMLFGVGAADPWTFVTVAAVLVAVAVAAACVPARRASKVDPMEALRYE